MRNLLRRSFSGLIYVLLLISATLFSKYAYLILISALGFFCIFEFLKMIESKAIIAYLTLPAFIFLMYQRQDSYPVIIILSFTILSSLFLLYQMLLKKEINFRDDRSKIGLTIRYVVFSIAFLGLLPFHKGIYNPYLIIAILVLIWTNDSFAFLVGKNFGKNKLFESISPKKTTEGFIGGVVFAIFAAILISFYNNSLTLIHWIFLALIVSFLGTAGDLIESKYKRNANIKDSGKIMPGHGGILDRLDSLMFAAPFVYLYINFII